MSNAAEESVADEGIADWPIRSSDIAFRAVPSDGDHVRMKEKRKADRIKTRDWEKGGLLRNAIDRSKYYEKDNRAISFGKWKVYTSSEVMTEHPEYFARLVKRKLAKAAEHLYEFKD